MDFESEKLKVISEKYLIMKRYPSSDKGNPSEVIDKYWLYAFRKDGYYPSSKSRGGKWLIFEDYATIDQIWDKIKQATENGVLGICSKVATAKSNENSSNPNQSVICVLTYDHQDKTDVMRIRQELKKLGITKKIPYKSDKKTREGVYKNRGDKNISEYFE